MKRFIKTSDGEIYDISEYDVESVTAMTSPPIPNYKFGLIPKIPGMARNDRIKLVKVYFYWNIVAESDSREELNETRKTAEESNKADSEI